MQLVEMEHVSRSDQSRLNLFEMARSGRPFSEWCTSWNLIWGDSDVGIVGMLPRYVTNEESTLSMGRWNGLLGADS